MDNKQKFFSKKNTVNTLSEAEYDQSQIYLETLRAFARITYMSTYIIDYQLRKFEYVSENPLFLCNHSTEEVASMGYNFYNQQICPEDRKMLSKVNKIGFNFFNRIPLEDRKNHSISYDFNLLNGKEKILVNHKLTPILMTDAGKIWKALCLVSLSANSSSGNIVITKAGENSFWEVDLPTSSWDKIEKMKLSDRELQILRLYAQGLGISQIADRICVAIDTVKFHRKKLFGKLNVKNIAEALAYSKHNKLL